MNRALPAPSPATAGRAAVPVSAFIGGTLPGLAGGGFGEWENGESGNGASREDQAGMVVAGGPDVAAPVRLSNEEKRDLGILSGEAWAHYVDTVDPLAEFNAGSKTASETAWRHAEIAKATAGHAQGQVGRIRDMRRGHLRTVQAHFLAMLGKDVESYQKGTTTGGKAGDTREDREQAAWLIRRACEQYGYPFPGYAIKIAKARVKSGLTDLLNVPAKVLKGVLFQVRTNGVAKRRKEGGGGNGGEGSHAETQRRGEGGAISSRPLKFFKVERGPDVAAEEEGRDE